MIDGDPAGWTPPERTSGPGDTGPTAALLRPGATLPTYSAPAPRRRGRGVVGIAVATVAALAAGAFAIASPAADAPSSPEAAVEAMFAALEDRDVLGVLDSLAPSERELYQPFIEDVVAELQRLEVLSGDLDLGSVGGIDIDIEGLTVTSERLGDGLSLVTVTGGTITSTVTPSEVPLGSFVRSVLEDPDAGVDLEPVTATADLATDEVGLVVVDDGGWHVSLHYTLAELLRAEAGAPLPDFSQRVVPAGAPTPEAAVEELVQAAVDLDLRRVIALLPPGEMSALHDYAPLFLDDAEAAIAELRSESVFDIDVDRIDTAAERDGGTAKVTVGGFAVSGTVEGETFDVDYDGRCVTGTAAGEQQQLCVDDVQQGDAGSFATELLDADLGVVTVERDGAWYVSPTRSLLDVVLAMVRVIDREDLEDPEAFLGEALGNPFLFGGLGLGPGAMTSTGGEVWVGGEPADGPDAGLDGVAPPGAPPAPAEDCWATYDALAPDATPEELESADAAFTLCTARSGAKSGG